MDVWNILGQTPLFVAAYLAKVEMVNMLLNLGMYQRLLFSEFYYSLNSENRD